MGISGSKTYQAQFSNPAALQQAQGQAYLSSTASQGGADQYYNSDQSAALPAGQEWASVSRGGQFQSSEWGGPQAPFPTEGFPSQGQAPIFRGQESAHNGQKLQEFYDNVEEQRVAKTAMAIFNGKQWMDTEGVLKRSTLNPKTVGTYWYSQPEGIGLGTGIDTVAGRGGWWPWFSDSEGSYAGGVRVEPANWPKEVQPPYVNAWRSGSQACGPSNPCPWGGPNNQGTWTKDYSGKWVKKGFCIRGKCSCPIGQDPERLCAGAAAIGATGDVLWSPSEYYPPTANLWELTPGY